MFVLILSKIIHWVIKVKKRKNKAEKETKKEKIYRFSYKKVLHFKYFIVMISVYEFRK